MNLHDTGSGTSKVPLEVFSDAAFCEKYRIETELGVGGAGVVVRAVHVELDRRVAIKFLLPGVVQNETLVRFRREAWAASRIRDEHVVRIIDVSKTSTGVPYVVMEYLDGSDMERMLLLTPHRQLPVRDAIEFVLQACEALAECHQIGIVHRDLKPSNLFCVELPDGLPLIKVLDFGISKFETFAADGSMTGQHTILGSPRYMSPEQFDSPADVDQRTDIWAIGVILYEFVTGKTPFEDNSVLEIWRKVKTVEPTALSELRRDVPIGLEPVIQRCLEKDPSRRYPNLAEFAKAIAHLASERARASIARIIRIVELPGVDTESLALPLPSSQSSEPSTISVVPKAPASPSTRQRWLIAISAIVGLGLAALGLSRPFQRAPETKKAAETRSSESVVANPTLATSSERNEPAAENEPLHAATPAAETASARPPEPVVSVKRPSQAVRRVDAIARTPPVVDREEAPAKEEDGAETTSEPSTSTSLPSVSPSGTAPETPPANAAPAPTISARGSPWIVDVVDQRKRKPTTTRP